VVSAHGLAGRACMITMGAGCGHADHAWVRWHAPTRLVIAKDGCACMITMGAGCGHADHAWVRWHAPIRLVIASSSAGCA